MTELQKANHLVTVYLLDKAFYVVGSVEAPPLLIWKEVNPVYIVEVENKEKLAHSIEAARTQSVSRFHQGHDNPEIIPWNGEKVWNNASKSWSVWWYADGSVDTAIDEPYDPNEPDLGEGKAWKHIKDGKKILSPPVSPQDIAQEILSKVN